MATRTYEDALFESTTPSDLSDENLDKLWNEMADIKAICQSKMDALKFEKNARLDAKIGQLTMELDSHKETSS